MLRQGPPVDRVAPGVLAPIGLGYFFVVFGAMINTVTFVIDNVLMVIVLGNRPVVECVAQ